MSLSSTAPKKVRITIEGDHNCAFNAPIVYLKYLIGNGNLDKNAAQSQYKSFFDFLSTRSPKFNLPEFKNWNAFKEYLRKTPNSDLQKNLALPFREFTIKFIRENKETQEKYTIDQRHASLGALQASFHNQFLGIPVEKHPDEYLINFPDLKDQMQKFVATSSEEYQKGDKSKREEIMDQALKIYVDWWNASGLNHVLNEMKKDKVWGTFAEIKALCDFWKITPYLKVEGHSKIQEGGYLGSVILDHNTAKKLWNREIINPHENNGEPYTWKKIENVETLRKALSTSSSEKDKLTSKEIETIVTFWKDTYVEQEQPVITLVFVNKNHWDIEVDESLVKPTSTASAEVKSSASTVTKPVEPKKTKTEAPKTTAPVKEEKTSESTKEIKKEPAASSPSKTTVTPTTPTTGTETPPTKPPIPNQPRPTTTASSPAKPAKAATPATSTQPISNSTVSSTTTPAAVPPTTQPASNNNASSSTPPTPPIAKPAASTTAPSTTAAAPQQPSATTTKPPQPTGPRPNTPPTQQQSPQPTTTPPQQQPIPVVTRTPTQTDTKNEITRTTLNIFSRLFTHKTIKSTDIKDLKTVIESNFTDNKDVKTENFLNKVTGFRLPPSVTIQEDPTAARSKIASSPKLPKDYCPNLNEGESKNLAISQGEAKGISFKAEYNGNALSVSVSNIPADLEDKLKATQASPDGNGRTIPSIESLSSADSLLQTVLAGNPEENSDTNKIKICTKAAGDKIKEERIRALILLCEANGLKYENLSDLQDWKPSATEVAQVKNEIIGRNLLTDIAAKQKEEKDNLAQDIQKLKRLEQDNKTNPEDQKTIKKVLEFVDQADKKKELDSKEVANTILRLR